VVGGGKVTLTGTNFTPNQQVTLKYYKGSSNTPSQQWIVFAACNGSFSTSVITASGLVVRTDHVTAVDTAGRQASANITVLLV